ncbi:hydrolase, NUDIX family [[Clostridium] methylpentosum DSM 5476]|uniref:Hydrolase, NUDIX family n=1 Tax=[Clostridium] methylpentosum DSM 5476 TaxID=537013 RepID=C0ECL8_9FIRM|nr:hydrolase, NUDIX family [[Clostridium] methylpentosum DSM 5476]MDY3989390.1 NUDIX domain-containing protein [Massilioclostridium sp.]MEE1490432.1 NUDIX domain-containing protein [Massilioclostridium sp.]
MNFIQMVTNYRPSCTQEAEDRQTILRYAQLAGPGVLERSDSIAHVTSSAFVLDTSLSHVLLVRHSLRGSWSWPGGHADGNPDLLSVAIRECREETGVRQLTPLSEQIASLDIFAVPAHWKNGDYVGAHLHFSVGFCLVCDRRQPLRPCPRENTAVEWFPLDFITDERFSDADTALYQRLIVRAKMFSQPKECLK